MSRTLVIGDIHGGLRALHQIMERANVSKNDTLIFLGDYVDGWSESPQVLDYLIALEKKQHCVFMRGNHDELVYKWLEESKDNREWYKHGGESTVIAYTKVNAATKQKHIEFLKNLKNYYLDDQNRLFIHAGFTNMNGVAYEYFPRLFYWDRTLWEMAIAMDKTIHKSSFFFPKRLRLFKEIYIGHTPTLYFNETTPMQGCNVWNLDTGAAFTGKLSIMNVDSKAYWQSDQLLQLYPGERGRNKG